MNNWPSVSVVILNWNGKKYLQQFLPSVLASTYPNYSVIVADNASSDDSLSFLQQYFPQVGIIKIEENLGYAKGYNYALAQVDADYFILLNSDVETTPNWIQPMIELMEKDEQIAACQPKILSYHHKEMFEYAGASGGWIDKYGYPFSRGRVFDTCEKDEGQYDNVAPIFWASGASLCVRAKAFKEMEGFDDYFFAHQEEIDLCWRMQTSGYRIFAQPESVVYHVGGGTLPMGSKRKVFLNFRNNLIMMHKNLGFGERCYKIPLRLFMDGLAAWQSLFKKDGTTFKAVFFAHNAYLAWVFGGSKKKNGKSKEMKALEGVTSKSIVWEYFIRKRKTFSEIV